MTRPAEVTLAVNGPKSLLLALLYSAPNALRDIGEPRIFILHKDNHVLLGSAKIIPLIPFYLAVIKTTYNTNSVENKEYSWPYREYDSPKS